MKHFISKKPFKNVIFVLLFAVFTFFTTCYYDKTTWINSWSGSLSGVGSFFSTMIVPGMKNVRTFVTPGLAGSEIKLQFSNHFGDNTVKINSVNIARVNEDGSLIEESVIPVLFNKATSVTMETGSEIWSDTLNFEVKALEKISVSYFIDYNNSTKTTLTWGGTLYWSASAKDIADETDTSANFALAMGPTVPFFKELSVKADEDTNTIVCFGDSITTTGWPENLAKRLYDSKRDDLVVIKGAIAGNRVLHDSAEVFFTGLFGLSGVTRFEDAITENDNVEYIMVLHGINDIAQAGPFGMAPESEFVTAEEIIAGLQTYIDLSRKHKVKIIGGTLMPYKGYGSYYDEGNNIRNTVNDWIRTSGEFDTYIDFDMITRDSTDPDMLNPAYDSGDHLHPNDAGHNAMSSAIPLKLFKGNHKKNTN